MQNVCVPNDVSLTTTKCKYLKEYSYKKEFLMIVSDLIHNPTVLQMKNYKQHYNTSCYEHCIEVAYLSYLICKKLNLDYASCARAGILHDLFLYDWRHSKKNLNLPKCHAFLHPTIALANSLKVCNLNDVEKDIILKHMWPVTFFQFPKYKESFVITITDKLSALNSLKNYIRQKIAFYKLSVKHI